MKVEARDDIIKRSIKLAMSTKPHSKHYITEMHADFIARVSKKLRERSKAEKRKIESTIKKTKLEDITSVLSCKGDMGPKLCTILMGKAVNQKCVHIWEDVSYWPVDGDG